MGKSVAVYRVNRRIIVAPVVCTTTRLGMEIDPEVLGECPAWEVVEGAISSAFARSGHIVTHPAQSEWKGFFDPFLKAAGVRSFKAFMGTAQLLYLDDENGSFVVTPNHNLGARKGFEPLIADRQTFPDLSAAAKAVLELFARS